MVNGFKRLPLRHLNVGSRIESIVGNRESTKDTLKQKERKRSDKAKDRSYGKTENTD